MLWITVAAVIGLAVGFVAGFRRPLISDVVAGIIVLGIVIVACSIDWHAADAALVAAWGR